MSFKLKTSSFDSKIVTVLRLRTLKAEILHAGAVLSSRF